MESAQGLASQDKLFGTDDPVFSYYQHISSHAPLPVDIGSEDVRQIVWEVGDDIVGEAKAGRLKSLELVLKFANPVNGKRLFTRLNNQELRGGNLTGDDQRELRFQLRPDLIQQGKNGLKISLSKDANQNSITLLSVRLWVRYVDRSEVPGK